MAMEATERPGNIWWGDFSIGTGESVLWDLGAVRFAVQRQELEWRIACRDRPGGEQPDWQVSHLHEIAEDFEEHWERYVSGNTDMPLHIVPALADRPVVSRPSPPFTLFPGEEVRIYLSTPLWVQITTSDKGTMLKEFPLLPLSDTWFGPSTREGDLCYATRTHARLELNATPLHVYRATTSLWLRNRASSSLVLERLNLPVTYLGLFHNGEGELWTEAIELLRDEDSDTAELKITPGSPEEIKAAQRISEPRAKSETGLLVRAFGSLFS